MKRLYRSRKQRVIAGVCGGIAEYFDIDPVWVRIATLVLALIDGIGILLYIIAWLLMPKHPKQKEPAEQRRNGSAVFGLLLVALGIGILLNRLDWFEPRFMWPLIIIAAGLYFLKEPHHA